MTRDTRDGIAGEFDGDGAPLSPDLSISSDETLRLSRADADAIRCTIGEMVRTIRGAAHSAQHGDTSALTYADGWTAASVLAQLVAADALARLGSG